MNGVTTQADAKTGHVPSLAKKFIIAQHRTEQGLSALPHLLRSPAYTTSQLTLNKISVGTLMEALVYTG